MNTLLTTLKRINRPSEVDLIEDMFPFDDVDFLLFSEPEPGRTEWGVCVTNIHEEQWYYHCYVSEEGKLALSAQMDEEDIAGRMDKAQHIYE